MAGKKIPDMLTAEELQTYWPGDRCGCDARSESDCSCGANWTPAEIYEQRNTICDLEETIARLERQLIAKIEDGRALALEVVSLKKENDLLRKEVKDAEAAAHDAASFAADMAAEHRLADLATEFGYDREHQAAVVETNYALQA